MKTFTRPDRITNTESLESPSVMKTVFFGIGAQPAEGQRADLTNGSAIPCSCAALGESPVIFFSGARETKRSLAPRAARVKIRAHGRSRGRRRQRRSARIRGRSRSRWRIRDSRSRRRAERARWPGCSTASGRVLREVAPRAGARRDRHRRHRRGERTGRAAAARRVERAARGSAGAHRLRAAHRHRAGRAAARPLVGRDCTRASTARCSWASPRRGDNGPFVVALSIDARTRAARPIYAPYLAVHRRPAGSASTCCARDADGVTRSFSLLIPTEDGGFPDARRPPVPDALEPVRRRPHRFRARRALPLRALSRSARDARCPARRASSSTAASC